MSRPYRKRGTGYVDERHGYIYIQKQGIVKCLHVWIAEEALGKPLPKGAVVHHADGNPSNNDPRNLVVCPDNAYHQLIHKRQRAYEACGHADWLWCVYCKKHDDPNNIETDRFGHTYHHKCQIDNGRIKRNGHLDVTRRKLGTGYVNSSGYISTRNNGISKGQHILVAEQALGRPLPKGALVYHIDGNKGNNAPKNLIVCPDLMYYKLLCKRQKAFEVCGNYNYHRCRYCKQYDDPINMYAPSVPKRSSYHQECMLNFYREKRAKKKQEKLGVSK